MNTLLRFGGLVGAHKAEAQSLSSTLAMLQVVGTCCLHNVIVSITSTVMLTEFNSSFIQLTANEVRKLLLGVCKE